MVLFVLLVLSNRNTTNRRNVRIDRSQKDRWKVVNGNYATEQAPEVLQWRWVALWLADVQQFQAG